MCLLFWYMRHSNRHKCGSTIDGWRNFECVCINIKYLLIQDLHNSMKYLYACLVHYNINNFAQFLNTSHVYVWFFFLAWVFRCLQYFSFWRKCEMWCDYISFSEYLCRFGKTESFTFSRKNLINEKCVIKSAFWSSLLKITFKAN